jgi:hypothetical protein
MSYNELQYTAATNPLMAVRLSSSPGYTRPGYPERLVWKDARAIELQVQIYDAIGELTDTDRAVILARYGEETTLQEYGDRIGRTRERVRQLEARAVRKLRFLLRNIIAELREATEIVPVKGGALDPDWLDTEWAAKITGYTASHIRWLCRTEKVTCQVNPLKKNSLQVSKKSLRAYVAAGQALGDRRYTGEWREPTK